MKSILVRVSVLCLAASLAASVAACQTIRPAVTETGRSAENEDQRSTSPLPSPSAANPTPGVISPADTPPSLSSRGPLVIPPPVEPLTQDLTGPIALDTAARVRQVGRWGGGSVTDIVYAPGGDRVALVTSLGVQVRDLGTLAELPFLSPSPDWSLAALSPDWSTVAWKLENLIRLQRTSDGQVLHTLEGQPGRLGRAAFSPDGAMLAGLRFAPGEEVYTASVELWRVSHGAPLGTWATDGADLAWSPDGQFLATWMAMSGVSIWRVPDGTLLHQIEGGAVGAAWSPDGQSLAVAGFGSGLQLWRASDWTQVWQFDVWPNRVRFSPDGSLLALAQTSGTALLVRAADGETLREVGYGLSDSAAPLAFSPDGRVLALGSSMDVQFWQVAGGALLQVLEGHSYGIASAAVSSDGGTVAFMTRSPSSPDAALQFWALATGSTTALPGSGEALSFAWSPDGRLAALGTWDFEVQLVQMPGGQVVRTLGPLSAQVQSVAFSPLGDRVAASAMGEVVLWHVADGTELHRWVLPASGWLDSVAFSPDGALLAAHAANPLGTIWLWDAETGEVVLTLASEGTEYLDNLAFLPDGTALAVEKPGELELWTVPDGVLLRRLEVAADAGPFAFSPDSALLALSAGEIVQLWDATQGELLATLVGHSGWVGSLSFSPDGRLLVTGSEDGTVRLWGVAADRP